MSLPTPDALASLLGGELHGPQPQKAAAGVAIDSRRVRPGDLFFALAGRQHDGHAFVAEALAAGAGLAVVRRGWGGPEDLPLITVAEPLKALQSLAAWYRRQEIGRVVAITGSNGKTVVKNALTAILAGRHRLAVSPGSWNSQVGVPLAVLTAPPGSELGIFEAGVSAPGEMEAIEAILRPDHGVLVNVGLAHIGTFGSRERTAREKLRLFRHLPRGGWLLLPDDPLLAQLQAGGEAELLRTPACLPPLLARRSTPSGTLLSLGFGEERLELPVRTRSAVLIEDLRIAMAAALRLGVTPAEIVAALEDHSFGPTRMETWRTPEGITIVNDTASDDPLSVQAALEAVAASRTPGGRLLFVFGGMGELGAREAGEHALIGRLAAERGFSELLLLPHPARDHTAAAWQAAAEEPNGLRQVDGLAALREHVHRSARPGDTLLVKGAASGNLTTAARELWESMAPRRLLVDLSAIRENIARFRSLCGPGVAILAVLKAWAYGTELPRLALGLQESGIDWIGVSAADEGAQLRRAGLQLPVLVMLMDIEEVDKAVRYGLTPVVYSLAFARALVDTLRAMNARCTVHLEIDTGMGRLGVAPAEAAAAARLLERSGVVQLSGVMTHFASADDPAADHHTLAQLASFDTALAAVRAEAAGPLCVHTAATAACVRFPAARRNMVRLGLGLYGIHPSAAIADALELELAVAFVSRLAQVALWARGQRVGYGGTYVVDAEGQRIGIVAAGYNDGVPWRLGNRGEVLVQGRRARVLGRVSMDSLAIDLSGIPDAAVGDEVLIFGARDGQQLRPEVVAAQAGTIPYELLVNVDTRRVQRIFRDA
jgi:alanine racemase